MLVWRLPTKYESNQPKGVDLKKEMLAICFLPSCGCNRLQDSSRSFNKDMVSIWEFLFEGTPCLAWCKVYRDARKTVEGPPFNTCIGWIEDVAGMSMADRHELVFRSGTSAEAKSERESLSSGGVVGFPKVLYGTPMGF